MGTTNFGVQNLSFDFNQDAEAKLFNKINHDLLPVGIYSGFTLTKQSNAYVLVSPGVCLIQDTLAGVSVRVETEENQSVAVSSLTPFVVFRFEWADVQNNYMDMVAVEYADILPSDIVVGRCVFDTSGTSLSDNFDYTRRSDQYLDKIKDEKDYFKVYPTEPVSNQFTVTSGILNSSKGNLIISGGTFPTGGLANTTNGRIDLVYIDTDGVIQVLMGTDASSPAAPRYGNRKVVAEIRRGASRTNIRGTDIFRVISSFDSAALTSDQLIADVGNFYASQNVEDALQEIAGSSFTFSGAKTFNAIVNFLSSILVRGAAGSNILTLQKSDATAVVTVDQNGKLTTTVAPDFPLTDTYGVFGTDKHSEAINQIGGGAMTIRGEKTFELSPTVPTTPSDNNTGKAASTAFVQSVKAIIDNSLSSKAPLSSPQFTGTPIAPTASVGTNNTQIATTEFVNSEIANDRPLSNGNPLMNGSATPGNSGEVSRANHVHPVDTSRAPNDSPALTGTPTVPTPSGSNSAQIANVAYVGSNNTSIINKINYGQYFPFNSAEVFLVSGTKTWTANLTGGQTYWEIFKFMYLPVGKYVISGELYQSDISGYDTYFYFKAAKNKSTFYTVGAIDNQWKSFSTSFELTGNELSDFMFYFHSTITSSVQAANVGVRNLKLIAFDCGFDSIRFSMFLNSLSDAASEYTSSSSALSQKTRPTVVFTSAIPPF